MAHIQFYEKPGCGGNARQQQLLRAAGHTLAVHDLLSTPWTEADLLAFLAPLPVAAWFNRAARRVKAGEIVPEALNAELALRLLIADPLLIRRPLMQSEGVRLVGFDPAEVDRHWGLQPEAARLQTSRTEGCAAAAAKAHDDDPGCTAHRA